MTLSQYSFFATVAKHQSVSKASEELRVSQPSISQQLRLLEKRQGVKLYRRLPHGVAITEAGETLLRGIAPILEQVSKVENGLVPRRIKSRPQALRVGGVDSSAALLLPSLLARFRQNHRTATVDLRTGTSDVLERLVASGTIELAVTVREAESKELACEFLRRERVAIFVRSNHRLSGKQRLQLADLKTIALIVRGGSGGAGVTDQALRQLRDRGVRIKIAMRCQGPTAIKAAVRERMGVGVAYEDAIRAEVRSGEFKLLKVQGLELAGQSYVVYSKNRSLSPLAQEFLEMVREVGRKK